MTLEQQPSLLTEKLSLTDTLSESEYLDWTCSTEGVLSVFESLLSTDELIRLGGKYYEDRRKYKQRCNKKRCVQKKKGKLIGKKPRAERIAYHWAVKLSCCYKDGLSSQRSTIYREKQAMQAVHSLHAEQSVDASADIDFEIDQLLNLSIPVGQSADADIDIDQLLDLFMPVVQSVDASASLSI